MKNIPKPPKPPLARVIAHGAVNACGLCPNCHSTMLRIPWIFGKKYCANDKCKYSKIPII